MAGSCLPAWGPFGLGGPETTLFVSTLCGVIELQHLPLEVSRNSSQRAATCFAYLKRQAQPIGNTRWLEAAGNGSLQQRSSDYDFGSRPAD